MFYFDTFSTISNIFVFGAFKTVRSNVSETIHIFSIDRVCRFENALPSQMYRKFATMQGDLAFLKIVNTFTYFQIHFNFSKLQSCIVWIFVILQAQIRYLHGYICLHSTKSKSSLFACTDCTVIVLAQVPFTFNDIIKRRPIVLMTQIQAIQWQFS